MTRRLQRCQRRPRAVGREKHRRGGHDDGWARGGLRADRQAQTKYQGERQTRVHEAAEHTGCLHVVEQDCILRAAYESCAAPCGALRLRWPA